MRVFALLCLLPLCLLGEISLSEKDVQDALDEGEKRVKAKNIQEMRLAADGSRIIESQKPNEDSQHDQIRGSILLEATRVLVEKNGREVLPLLAEFDVEPLLSKKVESRKKRSVNCPQETSNCLGREHAIFRSITGICNNRENLNFGRAGNTMRRLLGRNSYRDGFNDIRRAVSGAPLPSARLVSNIIHDDRNREIFDILVNHLIMQYGQFIAHDILFGPSATGPGGRPLDCSSCGSGSISGNCMPIPVPANDAYFRPNSCIRFARALIGGQNGLGPRSQINQNTHFLDLSAVYGSEECEAALVRSFVNGELTEFNNRGVILPPQNRNSTICQSRAPNFCFIAGDFRNSLQPGLIPIHTVYIKEHNRLARQFKRQAPEFTDEKIYQEVRRIMIGRHQHHVYNEYLPRLLAPEFMTRFNLTPLQEGYFQGYNVSLDPSLTIEFAAAGFRLHPQVRKDIPRFNNNNEAVSSAVPLGRNFLHTESLYRNEEGGPDSMLHGMMLQPCMRLNNLVSFPMRNQVFEQRGRRGSGVDLAAFNIQRGRDTGLLPYNEYRVAAGLRKVERFEELRDVMDAQSINLLQSVYQHVDDIDLYPAMLMETPSGGLLGRTGSTIIAETFSALKRGDRFFYETAADRSRFFNPDELAMVRKSRINKMYCTVTRDMALVPRDVFSLVGGRVPCSSIEQIDIAPFLATARLIQ